MGAAARHSTRTRKTIERDSRIARIILRIFGEVDLLTIRRTGAVLADAG